MNQPLNEAYKNEVLEAYQKISDTFDDFTQLMRKRVPYEQWPDHCKIAGVSEDFGCPPPGTKIKGFDKTPQMIPIPDLTDHTSNLIMIIDRLVYRIIDLGRVEEKIKNILDDEIFDTLSKHNPYWDSKHDLEADKLDDLRRKFSCLQDNLWDIMAILQKEREE